MTELEARLTQALRARSELAPTAERLLPRARTRARARRRGRLALAAVGVAVALAVPFGVVVGLRGGGVDTPAVEREGTRTETWHDVEIAVPASWSHGILSTWCTKGRGSVPTPVVERPGGAVLSLDCGEPRHSYGVQFLTVDQVNPDVPLGQYRWGAGPAARSYPNGAWVGDVALGHVGVRVVARDESTARAIVGSARVVEKVDSNGCAVRLEEVSASRAERFSVCRYDTAGWLVQSELLSPDDTGLALAALESAPATQAPPCPARSPSERPEQVVLASRSGVYSVVWEAACEADQGVFSGTEHNRLTADVMFWALSPGWSGVVDGTVPLPEQLRQ